ncbi:MAG: cation:proton antiporter [Methanoregulaceae archaeon]|nr:cation:proton antiporter [Methanoregulaceae archaeon]
MSFSIEGFELLLCVAAVVALLARRVRLPYTVGLVVAGAALAIFGVLDGFELTKDLIFKALLPPLVFEAAFSLRWRELKVTLVPVVVLASGGVIAAGFLTAAALSWLVGWPFPVALVFGSLIAATDPVSVLALFKETGVGGKLKLFVESESLLNDGAAAVMFGIAVLFASGTQLSVGQVALTLVREVGGGIVCGAAVAGTALYLAGRTTEHLVELLLTTVTAFGAFLLADMLHCSGVLAVVVAGLMIGNLGHFGAITEAGRVAVHAFWEFVAFVSNSIIFILIGVREVALGQSIPREVVVVVAAILVALLSRAIGVYGLLALFRGSRYRVEMRHQHVMVWGGLKGALSLALVLGLRKDFPYLSELTAAAFGVVAFSVIVQGMTISPLMRRLGLIGRPAPSDA